MKCEICEVEIPRGQAFRNEKYTAKKFCCEKHYVMYCNAKNGAIPVGRCACCGVKMGVDDMGYVEEQGQEAKFCSYECFSAFRKIRSSHKEKVNFKPVEGTERRKFTDYIQEWWPTNPNWPTLMKQAKDIQDEYSVSWNEMLAVLYYCKTIKQMTPNPKYGLYQFYPEYIQRAKDWAQALKENREKYNGWHYTEVYKPIQIKTNRKRLFRPR